jgi:hypothetical protein
MQYSGHQKGTVSEVIAILSFFAKSRSYLLLLDCELTTDIYYSAKVRIAYTEYTIVRNFRNYLCMWLCPSDKQNLAIRMLGKPSDGILLL